MDNIGEPRHLTHKFGEVTNNPYHIANQLDREPPKRAISNKVLNLGEGDYTCTACGADHLYYPCVAAGDEVIACCPDCSSLECIERKK